MTILSIDVSNKNNKCYDIGKFLFTFDDVDIMSLSFRNDKKYSLVQTFVLKKLIKDDECELLNSYGNMFQ
jgi:hypothetical protein